jgi:thiosulfate/3-mercaptopyruvate sulfurtransferase
VQKYTHLDDNQWMIFDCRYNLFDPDEGRNAYLRTHIPGAHFLDLACDLSGKKTGRNGRHPLPDPIEFAEELASLGLSNKKQVVVYDQAAHFSPRLWWMLRWIGHQAVAVLDGGFAKWVKEGYPVSEDVPETDPEKFTVSLQKSNVDVDFVAAHLNQPSLLLIDARAPERFNGENETIDPVGGHIPGAINRFFIDNFNGRGYFKSADVLKQEFSKVLDMFSPEQVVHQCGSGVTACHNLLAMEIAGLSGSKLYPGSWSEWCSDPKRPVSK